MSIEYRSALFRLKALEFDDSVNGRYERVRSIRELSLEQVQTWRKIPMTALNADPEPGMLGENAHFYWDGYLPLWSTSRPDSSPAVFVDLATGQLIRGNTYSEVSEQSETNRSTAQPGVPAEDTDLLKIDLEELDALLLLNKLRMHEIRISVLEDPESAYYLIGRRQAIINQLDLAPLYERPVGKKTK